MPSACAKTTFAGIIHQQLRIISSPPPYALQRFSSPLRVSRKENPDAEGGRADQVVTFEVDTERWDYVCGDNTPQACRRLMAAFLVSCKIIFLILSFGYFLQLPRISHKVKAWCGIDIVYDRNGKVDAENGNGLRLRFKDENAGGILFSIYIYIYKCTSLLFQVFNSHIIFLFSSSRHANPAGVCELIEL